VIATNPGTKVTQQGSGVVVAAERVVTNCHVLSKMRSVAVKSAEKRLPATLEYPAVELDLCQLKVPGLEAPVVRLAPPGGAKVGQRVYALGNPRSLELTLSDGLVSGLREVRGRRYIQTSASITHGSSGGGLFDSDGRLVAITTAGVAEGNLNFAVSAEYIPELAERGRAALARLRNPVPVATPLATVATAPSARYPRSLSGPEMVAHYKAYTVLSANPEQRWPFTLRLLGDEKIERTCPACTERVKAGRMSINPDRSEVCFDWPGGATYPDGGCYRVEQSSERRFVLRRTDGKSTIEYLVTP
jgi:hypothetical protein